MNTFSLQPAAEKLSTHTTNSYRCRACNTIWSQSQVRIILIGPVYICGDLFCDGTCDPVKQMKAKSSE